MKKIISIIICIAVVVFSIFAIVHGVKKITSKKLYDASTEATIVSIEREWTGTDSDGFDEYTYTVLVDYTVDGVEYTNKEYPGYDSSMQKGDKVEILYKSENPEEFIEANATGNGIIMIVIGGVFAVAGAVGAVKSFLVG